MSTETEADAPAPSERPRKAKKKKSKRPKLPIPQTEEEIDSPSKQTLGMLGVLGGLTLVLWSFAHGACNYHPPKETRRPRQVSTADLAREPKDAAIEFAQRLATLNFAGALELAKGPLADEVGKEKASCEAGAAQCAAQRSALKDKVLSVGELLERDPSSAAVRVTQHGLAGGPKRYIVRVERDTAFWKASSRVVDDGSFKAKPAAEGVNVSFTPGAAPAPAAPAKSPAAPAPSPHGPHDGHGH